MLQKIETLAGLKEDKKSPPVDQAAADFGNVSEEEEEEEEDNGDDIPGDADFREEVIDEQAQPPVPPVSIAEAPASESIIDLHER